MPVSHPDRAGHRWVLLWFWLMVAAMVWLRLGTSLLGVTVFAGFDVLDNFVPWSTLETAGDPYPHNIYVTDLVDAAIPAFAETSERLWAGESAWWSNLAIGGTPLLSNTSLGVVSPGRWAWLVLPLTIAPAWAKLFELLFAGAFTYLFARRLSLGTLSSSLAAFVYPMTGFTIAWTGWAQSGVAAVIPMLFWAVERHLQDRRVRTIGPVALASALLLFGGFPAVAGHAFYFAGAYALVRALTIGGRTGWAARLRSAAAALARLALGVILGALLSAVQLLPLLSDLSSTSTEYREGWFRLQDPLLTWVTTVLPRSVVTDASHQDIAAYTGAVALILASLGLLALLHRRIPHGPALVLLGGAILSFALISLQGGWSNWIGELPIFAGNPVGRLRAQLALPIAIYAALGVEWLLGTPAPSTRFPWLRPGFTWPTALVAAGALAALSRPIWLWRTGQLTGPSDAIRHDLLAAYLPATIVVALVVAAVVIRQVRAVAVAGALTAVVGQALVPTAFFWPIAEPEEVYPDSAATDFLADAVEDGYAATAGLAMRPNVTAHYGIRTLTGHGFADEDLREVLMGADPVAYSTGGTFSYLDPGRSTIADNPGLDRLAVTHVVAAASELLPGQWGVPVPITGESEAPTLDGVGPAPDEFAVDLEAAELRAVVVPIESDSMVTVDVTVVDGAGAEVARNSVTWEAAGDPDVVGDVVDAAVPFVLTEAQREEGPVRATVAISSVDPTTPPQVGRCAGAPCAWTMEAPEVDVVPVVFAGDGIVVFERTTALTRIRFASSPLVIEDDDARLAAVLKRPVTADEVILSAPTDWTTGPGSTAEIAILEDNGDVLTLEVTAEGAGFVVVQQSMLGRFSATVDGENAPVVAADESGVAVPVATGAHTVTLRFESPSMALGALISGAAALVALVLWLAGPLRDWRRRSAVAAS